MRNNNDYRRHILIVNEIERKILISKEVYEHMLKEYSRIISDRILQINYYYDTYSRQLHRVGSTLRIRQIDNKLTLQLKTKEKNKKDIRISSERSIDVQTLPQIIRMNNIHTYYLGMLITERVKVVLNSYTLFFDKNSYLGKVDYELEVEAGNVEDMPTSVLGLTFDGGCIGKYTRFLNELDIQKSEIIDIP